MLRLACMGRAVAVCVHAKADGEPALAQGVAQISSVQTSAEHLAICVPCNRAAEKGARTARGLHGRKESGREKPPFCALQQQAELGQI
jgi:hypothetical protein